MSDIMQDESIAVGVKTFEAAKVKDSKLRTCRTPESNAAFYQQWSNAYENDMTLIGYAGPKAAAQSVLDYVKDKDARILDVAAGTGMVTGHLKSFGFNNVDGLDPSTKMLDIAREKGLYREYICEFISGEATPGIEENSYDVAVSCGSFSDGHLKSEVLKELTRIVKSGGIVTWAMREAYLKYPDYVSLQPLADQLEEEGKWKLVERRTIPGYYNTLPGVVFVYRVL